MARAAAGRGVPARSWIVRLLGGRRIVQGAAIKLRPSDQALSMLVMAGVSSRHQVAAVKSAIAALMFSGLEMAARP